MCDTHPNIVQWASEPVKIPYVNPFTGKHTVYVPDFLIVFEDKDGNRRTEMIEVKPARQAKIHEAKTEKDKMSVVLNAAKWEAAEAYCKKYKIFFRVICETDIYNNPKKR